MIEKKKILLLLNNAPDVKIHTNDLYKKLSEEGLEVVVAAESLFYQYTLDLDIPIKYVFSQYFKSTKELLFIHKDLEKFNIWESYYSDYDRSLYLKNTPNSTFIHKALISLYNFFYEIFAKEKITIVWHEPVSNSFNNVAYNISTLFNAKYIGFGYSRLPNRYELSNSLYPNADKYLSEYNNFRTDEISLSGIESDYIKNYLHDFDDIQPDYMKINGLNATDPFIFPYLKKRKIKYIIRLLYYIIKERKNDFPYAYQIKNPLLSSFMTFLRQLKRRFKLPLLRFFFYKSILESNNDSFFLYPLHYHPESSTSIWAKHFSDELSTIINIAFNLPFGHKLYIKDHPSAAGFPSLSFYDKLSKIPNVVLIDYKSNTKNLIKKSKKVITLTSTVGFEALILGKQVIVLGNIFYEKHPLVIKINNFDNLFYILSQDNPVFEKTTHEMDSFKTVIAYYRMTMALDKYSSVIDLIMDVIKTTDNEFPT